MTSIVLFCPANFEKEKKKKPLAMSETSACLEAYFELCNSYYRRPYVEKHISGTYEPNSGLWLSELTKKTENKNDKF